MQLQVHLGQRLLQVLNVGGGVVQQPLALAQIGAQGGDVALRPEAAPQQTVLVQPLQPLRILHIGLAAWDVLGVTGITSTTSNPRCSRSS